MLPWRDWYHVTGNTYGTWLPGDERGWKTRHARHQPGAPPELPPEPDRQCLQASSRRRMARDPVTLSPEARRIALDAIRVSLRTHEIETITAAVNDHHFHFLARIPDHNPRKWAGIAKKESARALSTASLAAPGGVWAVRSHAKPIRDREHQLIVAHYIADHESEGAAVWAVWKADRATE